jgi:hypothetical protein
MQPHLTQLRVIHSLCCHFGQLGTHRLRHGDMRDGSLTKESAGTPPGQIDVLIRQD